jgi:hypothetical protein
MVKTVNQLLCGVHIAAAAEAFSLAAKAGLDGAPAPDPRRFRRFVLDAQQSRAAHAPG